MPSEEEQALDKALAENRLVEPPPLGISFVIPHEVLEEAIIHAVQQEMLTSSVLRNWVVEQIRKTLDEVGPDSEAMKALREQVGGYLKRYPDLDRDSALQEKVASVILRHIQGPTARRF